MPGEAGRCDVVHGHLSVVASSVSRWWHHLCHVGGVISSFLAASKERINTMLLLWSHYKFCLENGFMLCHFLFSLQCLL